jgi:hypothetical protein
MSYFVKKIIVIISIIFTINIYLICNEDTDLIESYYNYLCSEKDETYLKRAYQISTKKVPFDTFCSWYRDTCGNKIFQMENLGNNTYHFKVLLEEKTDQKYIYSYDLFDVTMVIAENRIKSSTSKRLSRMIQETVRLNDGRKILIILNAEKDQYEVSILQEGKEILLLKEGIKLIYYIPTFNRIQQLDQILLVQYTEYEHITNVVIDLNTLDITNLKLPNIFVSPDERYLINYTSEGHFNFGGYEYGMVLEFADNQYIGKSLMDVESGFEEFKYTIKNNQSFLSFKEYPSSENHTYVSSDDNAARREINLTELIRAINLKK